MLHRAKRYRGRKYAKPELKESNFSKDEDDLILKLHALLGNRFSFFFFNSISSVIIKIYHNVNVCNNKILMVRFQMVTDSGKIAWTNRRRSKDPLGKLLREETHENGNRSN